MGLSGHRCEGCGHRDDLGARGAQRSKELGEAHVVTHGEADTWPSTSEATT